MAIQATATASTMGDDAESSSNKAGDKDMAGDSVTSVDNTKNSNSSNSNSNSNSSKNLQQPLRPASRAHRGPGRA